MILTVADWVSGERTMSADASHWWRLGARMARSARFAIPSAEGIQNYCSTQGASGPQTGPKQ